jgi:streptomycin 6-kinase
MRASSPPAAREHIRVRPEEHRLAEVTEGAADRIVLPQSFLEMPRWWSAGAGWLADLPALVQRQCERWDLTVSGAPAHGSNALVLPVTRNGSEFALRMTPPAADVAAQVHALRFWDGRGTVHLVDADPARGAMLLERLSMDESLTSLPVGEAVAVLGRMIRRLAVPAPPEVRSTATAARTRAAELEPSWRRLRGPFDRVFLDAALGLAATLGETRSGLAVNGDLHSGQVLRGTREPWLTVDPLLMRGDVEYDLARVLWTRLDEMAGDAEVRRHFETAVAQGGLDRRRARDWVLFRAVDYWLWGLEAGLTEDPARCRRLVSVFLNR